MNLNILVTGTPGTGKTTFCEIFASRYGYNHVNVGQLIKEKKFYLEKDPEFDSFVLDEENEDKLLDEMESTVSRGGNIVDFHSCDFFPERWFHLIVVLRVENSLLYERLEKRGYNNKKITENIQCEIFQIVLEEARDSYNPAIVVELENNNLEQIEENITKIANWVSSQPQ